ncbi:MAG: hypothetical protein QXK14_00795, partial [Acidilobaceae archaeon]
MKKASSASPSSKLIEILTTLEIARQIIQMYPKASLLSTLPTLGLNVKRAKLEATENRAIAIIAICQSVLLNIIKGTKTGIETTAVAMISEAVFETEKKSLHWSLVFCIASFKNIAVTSVLG